MDKKFEKELEGIAERCGLTLKEFKAEMKPYMDKGLNEQNAAIMVQGKHGTAMRSIPGTYHILPMLVSEPVEKIITRGGEEVESEVVKITGLFHGPTSRGGKDTAFITTMSLWDEKIGKLDSIRQQEWNVFKGYLNPARGSIGIGNDAEFQEDPSPPDLADCLREMSQNAVAPNDLFTQNEQGEYIHDREDVLVFGLVNRVPEDGEGRKPIEIASLGGLGVTVWPPFEGEFPPIEEATMVLIYGYHQIKNGGESHISTKLIFEVPQE